MSNQTDTSQEDTIAGGEQGQFGLQKIYVRDVSFETPHSPQIFQEQWKPSVNMDIANAVNSLSKELFEVVLSVTVTVSFEGKTVYLAEIHQAGIFHIDGFPDEIRGRMLATICPNILFPFAREFIADLIMRGGFPQLLLAPVNFEALYLQQQQKQTEQADTRR
ncbi:MAG: protein-export chaperone SecB [Gammaproteobacteria bacterium]